MIAVIGRKISVIKKEVKSANSKIKLSDNGGRKITVIIP